MPDRELEIHLKTTADRSGVQAVDTDLTKLGETGVEMTAEQQEAYEKFQAQKQRLNAKAAQEEKAQADEKLKLIDREAERVTAAFREAERESERAIAQQNLAATRQAAEQNAALQRASHVKELASQSREIAQNLNNALTVTGDGQASVIQQFDALSQAGASAFGGIAAGYMAFGPTGAVVMTAMSGLRVVGEMMEQTEKDSAKRMAAMVRQAEETAAALDKILNADSGFDYSQTRTQVEEQRRRTEQETERQMDKARRDASLKRQTGDLSDEGEDGPEKERRRIDREDEERRTIEQVRRAAVATRLAQEQEARRRLDLERETLEEEQNTKARELRNSTLNNQTDPDSKAELARRIAEVNTITKELARVRDALKQSQTRTDDMTSGDADARDEVSGNAEVGRLRGNRAVDTAIQRKNEEERKEAERRRAAAQKAMEEQVRERSRILSDTAGEFSDNNRGSRGGRAGRSADARLSDLSKAADALKDGATQQELDKLEQAVKGMVGTVLAKEEQTNASLSRIWRMIESLKKDLATTTAAAKNQRDTE